MGGMSPALIACKIRNLRPNSTLKLAHEEIAHEGRIAQVYISRLSIHSPTLGAMSPALQRLISLLLSVSECCTFNPCC